MPFLGMVRPNANAARAQTLTPPPAASLPDRSAMTWKPPKYTISDAFRMFCTRTNGHGWWRVRRARNQRSTCCWFTLSVLFFAVGVAYTAAVLIKFIRYETVSETSIWAKVGAQPFPAVTVCNNNPIKNSLIANATPIAYREALEEIPRKIARNFELPYYRIYYGEKLKGNYLDMRAEGAEDLIKAAAHATVAQRSSLGYSLQDLVTYCSFGGRRCNIDHTEWTHFYDDLFGNCYTWNAANTDRMTAAGIDNGLHLAIRQHTSDYLPWYTESSGAKVVVHEPNSMPLVISEGISVIGSLETDLGIDSTEWQRLAEPHNNPGCVSDYDNYAALYGYKYNSAGCRKTCVQRAVMRECGCADPRAAPRASGATLCDVDDAAVIGCMLRVRRSFEQKPDDRCLCPPTCNETIYGMDLSFSIFSASLPFDEYTNMFGEHPGRMALVRIYFRTPVTNVYTDLKAETQWQFFGWVGGQLWAWTGASVITLIEFAVFLLGAVLVMFTENVDWLLQDKNK